MSCACDDPCQHNRRCLGVCHGECYSRRPCPLESPGGCDDMEPYEDEPADFEYVPEGKR